MERSGFVLDASVALAWAFRGEMNPYTVSVLRSLTAEEAFVPPVWPLEVGDGILVAERRGRLTQAEGVRFLMLSQELPVVMESETAGRVLTEILALARERVLSTYDASYLDLAMRLGLPLATQDQKLREAASRSGVRIWRAESE